MGTQRFHHDVADCCDSDNMGVPMDDGTDDDQVPERRSHMLCMWKVKACKARSRDVAFLLLHGKGRDCVHAPHYCDHSGLTVDIAVVGCMHANVVTPATGVELPHRA